MDMRASERLENGSVNHLKEGVEDVTHHLKKAGDSAKTAVRQVVGDLSEVGQEKFDTYYVEGKKVLETAQDYVKSNPTRSIVMSLLAGAVLGTLCRAARR